MAIKTLKTRIVHKHDVEANWNLATGFIPMDGEIIIYDADANYSYKRVKIGDGSTNVANLPFIDDAIKELIPEINDATTSTVDTWSSQKISDELANASGVKTVNGVEPDENGNVEIKVSTEDVSVDLSNYYTKTQIDDMEFITLDDIDTICGTVIQDASLEEVTF